MAERRNYLKSLTGKTREELFTRKRRPYKESLDDIWKLSKTRRGLRVLGIGNESVRLTEEEREANFHILGAPGEGKSKFIEDSIRKDIDLGNGICLLDPSDGGRTCYDVLRYCASIGHKKVVLIDPSTLFHHKKIAVLSPLTSRYVKMSVDGVWETVNILFDAKGNETPRLKRNLSALLRVLAKGGFTIRESLYFSEYAKDKFKREEILKTVENKYPDDRDVRTLDNLFRSNHHFETYFYSTINRLDMFWEVPLSLMLGASEGIDFVKMISEGWTVLVNLFPGKFINQEEARLIGVLVISQIIQAADILFEAHPRGVKKRDFYLYMDEAARFATPQIDTVLSYKRKVGIHLILAHHYFNQFENRKVLNSIKQGARIKVMFNTPSYDDRLEMIKDLGYGGDIPPLLASYANQNLPKQYAIIKKNKESPVRIRIPDVPPVTVSDEQFETYLQEILSHKWYLTKEQVTEQISRRISYPNDRTIQKNTPGVKSRKTPDRKTDRPPNIPAGIRERQQQQSLPKSDEKPQDAGKRTPITF